MKLWNDTIVRDLLMPEGRMAGNYVKAQILYMVTVAVGIGKCKQYDVTYVRNSNETMAVKCNLRKEWRGERTVWWKKILQTDLKRECDTITCNPIDIDLDVTVWWPSRGGSITSGEAFWTIVTDPTITTVLYYDDPNYVMLCMIILCDTYDM